MQFFDKLFSVVQYRFSSDIVKTLLFYYFMLLKYMCEVS